MSTSSGRTPLAAKSFMSRPHGTSGVSAGFGPSPVSTRTVRPSERIRYDPRLKRTLCSSVRCDSCGCQFSEGMVGKKLHRSNSSMPSDSDMISTFPTRITLLAIDSPLGWPCWLRERRDRLSSAAGLHPVPCMMRPAPSGVKASGARRLLRADEAHVEALLEHGLVVHAAQLIAARIVRERVRAARIPGRLQLDEHLERVSI